MILAIALGCLLALAAMRWLDVIFEILGVLLILALFIIWSQW